MFCPHLCIKDRKVQTEVERGAYWFGPVRRSVYLSIYASYKEADTYMLRKDICYTDLIVALKRKSTLNVAI